MMYNYPFFSFPHFRRYSNYYPVPYSYVNNDSQKYKCSTYSNKQQRDKYSTYSNKQLKDKYSTYSNKQQKEGNSSKRTPSGFSFLSNILHQEDRDDDEEYFDLFGLKLYYDDLLLIGLMFFLYKEDVKDQYLFFALVLLLLS